MPIHYGYIPETLNTKEGDEIDVLVLSDDATEIGQEIEVEPIALISREDGDDKVVAVDKTRKATRKWEDISESERKLIESFFSYHHKFRSIEDEKTARRYVNNGREQYMRVRH